MTSSAPLLDEAQARFITRRVAMSVASANAERVPSVARAFGCRVSPDRKSVTVILSTTHSSVLLSDLRNGGALAAVFSLPSTHETLQLKGKSARVSPLENGDRAIMQTYCKSFSDELRAVGYQSAFATAIVATVDEAVCVTFTPTAAFVQTPGPSAGQPLGTKP